MEVQYTILWYN